MRTFFRNLAGLGLMAVAPLAWGAVTAVSGSFTGGVENNENDGSTLEKVVDGGTAFYLQASQTDPTWSFKLDLGQVTTVTQVGIYGYERYRGGVLGPGGVTSIEVADDVDGPYTVIGSRDFGGDRATNPWSGCIGQMIPATPTQGRYLRISGGWDFDNLLRISEVYINPPFVVYKTDPVHNPDFPIGDPNNVVGAPQRSVFDLGGPFPRRSPADLADGRIWDNSGITPQGLRPTLFYDIGPGKTISKVEFYSFEFDWQVLPKTGVVSVSSTDDPNAIDTVAINYDVTPELTPNPNPPPEADLGKVTIEFPTPQSKRFYKIEVTAPQDAAFGFGDVWRASEVKFIEAGSEPPPPSATRNWELY